MNSSACALDGASQATVAKNRSGDPSGTSVVSYFDAKLTERCEHGPSVVWHRRLLAPAEVEHDPSKPLAAVRVRRFRCGRRRTARRRRHGKARPAATTTGNAVVCRTHTIGIAGTATTSAIAAATTTPPASSAPSPPWPLPLVLVITVVEFANPV